MKTYRELLFSHVDELEDNQVAKLLLFELCQEKDINLYLDLDEEVDADIYQRYEEGIKRLLKQEPLAYILGYRWFYGYKFKVNQDTLIPRDETEELVAYILSTLDEYFDGKEVIKCADIGTGSGNIALSLLKEEKKIEMIATDISDKALALAKENSENLDVKCEFMLGDMLKPLIENNKKVDILISNPPYIPKNEEIEVSVKDYEPNIALFGGEDGLQYYRELLANASKVLNDKAFIFFEIGWNQKEEITNLAKQYFPDSLIEVKKDINGKNRMFRLEYNSGGER